MLYALLLDRDSIWCFYCYVAAFYDTVVFRILHAHSIRTYLKTCESVVSSLPFEGTIRLLQSKFVLTWSSACGDFKGTIATIMTAYSWLTCYWVYREFFLRSYLYWLRIYSTFTMSCYLVQYTDDIGLSSTSCQIHIQVELCIVMWLVYLGSTYFCE